MSDIVNIEDLAGLSIEKPNGSDALDLAIAELTEGNRGRTYRTMLLMAEKYAEGESKSVLQKALRQHQARTTTEPAKVTPKGSEPKKSKKSKQIRKLKWLKKLSDR